MRLILDAMGGDLGCEPVVLGAAESRKELDVDFTLAGDEKELKEVFSRHNLSMDGFTILHAPDVVTMEDDPTRVVREKRRSSMAVALEALKKGEGDAVVSSCNTGALLTGATLLVGRVRGVRRAAIGLIMPTKNDGHVIVVDTGANSDCTPEYLLQFALIGSAYSQSYLGVDNPKIALLSNGTEAHKGNALIKETHAELEKLGESGLINFVGNTEARDVMSGNFDVVVCDGFSGNILLKATEGAASFIISLLKEIFMSSILKKIAALMVKSKLEILKKKLDYREIGASPILGISKPVFKAHGASDASAWSGAIRTAYNYVNCGANELIAAKLGEFKRSEENGN